MKATYAIVGAATDGHDGARAAMVRLKMAFTEAVVGDGSRTEAEAEREFQRSLDGAVAQMDGGEIPADPCQAQMADRDWMSALTATLEAITDRIVPEADSEPYTLSGGGGWLLDASPDPEPIWGDGHSVLWSKDEPCLVTGPIGAGKTTLAGHLVRGLVGLDQSVLGFTVVPARRVLYLALDRPRQIARNLRRMVVEGERAQLDDRLVFLVGNVGNLIRDPESLWHAATAADADCVIVDGLKDIAPGLSDEATGQAINTAHQICVRNGVQVLAMHHQRKEQGGKQAEKPKALSDLYGSTWIPAGAGTVLLVWADQAGDVAVEFSTLKPAADQVGPLMLVHDTAAGRMEIDSAAREPSAMEALLRAGGWVTVAQVAEAMGRDVKSKDKRPAIERTRRDLVRLVKDGKCETRETANAQGGGTVTWYMLSSTAAL